MRRTSILIYVTGLSLIIMVSILPITLSPKNKGQNPVGKSILENKQIKESTNINDFHNKTLKKAPLISEDFSNRLIYHKNNRYNILSQKKSKTGTNYTNHVPIRIDSDADFKTNSGVIAGNGTQKNPWMIEGWEINGTGKNSCVYIGNTTDYFVVRNCYLHHADGGDIVLPIENCGLYLYNVTNGRAYNNTISSNARDGIHLHSSSNNIISDNRVSSNDRYGISLDSKHLFSLSQGDYNLTEGAIPPKWRNRFEEENFHLPEDVAIAEEEGIWWIIVEGKKKHLIQEQNSGLVIYQTSCNNLLIDNYLLNDIKCEDSGNNTLRNNSIPNGGFYFCDSPGNILLNNSIEEGIDIHGGLSHWNTHHIDPSNTVDGRPVYYWKNRIGGTVPIGGGEIILANCSAVTVKNQTLETSVLLGFSSNNAIFKNRISQKSMKGIYISHSNKNVIYHNVIRNNSITLWKAHNNSLIDNSVLNNSIYMYYSDHNFIAHNEVKNGYSGCYIYDGSYNKITDNHLSNCLHGIVISRTSSPSINNTVSQNIISNNTVGIVLKERAYWYTKNTKILENTFKNNKQSISISRDSISTVIYHNNFINNTEKPEDNGGSSWDNGYPSGGNYWSDYNGTDNYSGANQTQLEGDGIGDSPYTNISGGRDVYPLMKPWSIQEKNHPPIQPFYHSPIDGEEKMKLDPTLSIKVLDIDKDTMDFSFYDASDESLIGTVSDVSSGNTASIKWPDLLSNTTYHWYVIVDDGENKTRSATWSFTTVFINHPPEPPISVYPIEGSKDIGISPNLTVSLSDPNGDSMDVTFYDALEDRKIGNATSVPSGGVASITWSNLSYNTTYEWYVNVTDGTNTTRSDTWSFTTVGYDVSVSAPPDERTSERRITLHFTVANTGDLNATYEIDVSASRSGWTVDSNIQSINISKGETKKVIVNLTIPESASKGDTAAVELTATSSADSSVKSTGSVQVEYTGEKGKSQNWMLMLGLIVLMGIIIILVLSWRRKT